MPVSYFDVDLTDRFWAPRQQLLHGVSVPWATRNLDPAGGLAAFIADPGGYEPAIRAGNYEVIKFVESLATVVGLRRDEAIEDLTDAWGRRLRQSQASDGYFFFANRRGADPVKRWELSDDEEDETYALGHYLEAGIAYLEATGKAALYGSAVRAVDNMARELLDGERAYASIHPEIEQALTRLYGVTGDQKYLRLCGWLIEQRGRHDGRRRLGKAAQDHLPIREQRTIEGHAVCAGYLFNGVTEYVGATGDEGLREAVLAIWDDFVEHKMYLHGGGGTISSGFEGYSEPDVISPSDAYCESCAVFANFQWAHNLFRLTGDAKYVDVAERMLYNAFYASMSLSGDRFFYQNYIQATYSPVIRGRWHWCPCCPPNIVKLFAKVGGFFYSIDHEGVFIKHYGESIADVAVGDGVRLAQRTAYPWDGEIAIIVEPKTPSEFTVRLRVPAWTTTTKPRLTVNGKPVEVNVQKGWAAVRRRWRTGDTIELNLPMPIRRVTMPPRFAEYEDLAALERGPIVYCLEQQDTPAPLPSICLPDDVDLKARHEPDLLGGITVLDTTLPQEPIVPNTWDEPVSATFVPYGVWNNRGDDFMKVWLSTRPRSSEELAEVRQRMLNTTDER